jgi:hypothetical protein
MPDGEFALSIRVDEQTCIYFAFTFLDFVEGFDQNRGELLKIES